MAARPDNTRIPDQDALAWAALLALGGGDARDDRAIQGDPGQPRRWLQRGPDGRQQISPDAPPSCRDLLSLYLPLCDASQWTVGHLGQSLDGCIATADGDSCYVTGPANIRHLHRMRALCDAVIVGAGTVAHDDPRLTTRLVPGTSPVRVVLDPGRRLADHHRVFRDGAAQTLLCCAEGDTGQTPGDAELMPLPAVDGVPRLDALVTALAARGLHRLFVEGGGVTVSRFLAAGLLSRLQLAVAPLVIGQGRPGLQLPRTERLAEALRLTPRIYRMGKDVLYDVDLAAGGATAVGGGEDDPEEILVRVL
jgi:riboflavin-specific deaminase-like protein